MSRGNQAEPGLILRDTPSGKFHAQTVWMILIDARFHIKGQGLFDLVTGNHLPDILTALNNYEKQFQY